MNNFTHKCTSCKHSFATCGGEPIFLSDTSPRIQSLAPKDSYPDTILWCSGYKKSSFLQDLFNAIKGVLNDGRHRYDR